jgi:hypothetical protein
MGSCSEQFADRRTSGAIVRPPRGTPHLTRVIHRFGQNPVRERYASERACSSLRSAQRRSFARTALPFVAFKLYSGAKIAPSGCARRFHDLSARIRTRPWSTHAKKLLGGSGGACRVCFDPVSVDASKPRYPKFCNIHLDPHEASLPNALTLRPQGPGLRPRSGRRGTYRSRASRNQSHKPQ